MLKGGPRNKSGVKGKGGTFRPTALKQFAIMQLYCNSGNEGGALKSRREFLAMSLTGAGLLAVGGCDLFPHAYRFRITVSVMTPQGLRSGSSVLEASAAEQPIKIGTAKRVALRGEAICVDLPGGQTLFALIDEAWPGLIARLFIPDLSNETQLFVRGFGTLGGYAMRGQVRELPRGKFPRFVRFRDIRDRKTAEVVHPDNLAATFGPGFSLDKITAELTDNRLTKVIERQIPKPDVKGFFNWDGIDNPNDPSVMHISYFVRRGT